METQLSGSHRATYDAIFQHPVSRNLKWADVRSMLVAMADTVQEDGDTLKVTRHGKSLVLHRPGRSGMGDIAELMKVRSFLAQSPPTVARPVSEGVHLLVVLDHRMARIYKADVQGSVPQRIVPYDRNGTGRHLHHVEADATGHRKPEVKSFYEAIARTLKDAEKVLIFGSGTGASSAMEQLLIELREHHGDVARRVVGSVVVNEQHLTENQLLAKAREFYAKSPTSGNGRGSNGQKEQ